MGSVFRKGRRLATALFATGKQCDQIFRIRMAKFVEAVWPNLFAALPNGLVDLIFRFLCLTLSIFIAEKMEMQYLRANTSSTQFIGVPELYNHQNIKIAGHTDLIKK
jgi:hypothetical protein